MLVIEFANRVSLGLPSLGSCLLLAFVVSVVTGDAYAEDQPSDPDSPHPTVFHLQLVEKFKEGLYSTRGADACLGCHDEEEAFPTLDVFESVHGNPHIRGSPFRRDEIAKPPEGLQCESCHGPAGEHTQKFLFDGQVREPMLNFAPAANARPDLQNQVCLACHDDYKRTHWQNSVHDWSNLACTDCHRIHDAEDPVRTTAAHNRECGSCHLDVLNDMFKTSSHPMVENQLLCRDCHDPHGGKLNATTLIRQATTIELCLSCHQEKRGPFLFEHPPVLEDCALCHRPHGSNQQALLTQRVPQLCQSCHSSVGHRSLVMDPNRRPSEINAEFQFLNACLNCHALVHGSNHPSGNLFRR